MTSRSGLERMEHPIRPEVIRRPPPLPRHDQTRPVTQDQILALQRSAGNRAVNIALSRCVPTIQRDPPSDPQVLGSAAAGESETVDESSRAIVSLKMGQGFVAHLGETIIYSNEFSSCSPVVMFNSGTLMGSLYHFPSEALTRTRKGDDEEDRRDPDDVLVENSLGAIYDAVQPDEIYVCDRNTTLIHGVRSVMDHYEEVKDVDALQAFFGEKGFKEGVTAITIKSNSYSVTLGPEGTVVKIEPRKIAGGKEHSIALDRNEEERSALVAGWEGPPGTKYGRNLWDPMEQDRQEDEQQKRRGCCVLF